jgi:hypothetical protein
MRASEVKCRRLKADPIGLKPAPALIVGDVGDVGEAPTRPSSGGVYEP